MKAIKGRGLAGAQLTTSGSGEEGHPRTRTLASAEKEQVNCGEGEVWQFVQLSVCLSVGANMASLTLYLSIFL